MSVYRSALLRFADDGRALYDEDGLLAIGPDAQGRQRVLAAGSWQALGSQYADQPVSHLPGRILAPGFVDMHIHFPQTDVIGSPADGLLPWLENYTFPHEKRFAADAACPSRSFSPSVTSLPTGLQRCSRTETPLTTISSQIIVVTTGSMNIFFPGRIKLRLNTSASQRFG